MIWTKKECKRCGQGWVHRAFVRKTGLPVFVCDECEALWVNEEDVELGPGFVDLVQYLTRLGAGEGWGDLELED